jgi:site-specific DNA-cytosine methylase
VFVVGHLGDWRPAAKVLFESESLSRNTKSSREKEENNSYKLKVGTITKSWGKGLGHNGQDDMAVIHPISFPAAMSGTQAAYSKNKSLTLQAKNNTAVCNKLSVRRLTPIECERLQGFSDNYTNIPNAADTNRYKALGNSMAVPVMRWIGERINSYETMRSKAVVQVETRMGIAEV